MRGGRNFRFIGSDGERERAAGTDALVGIARLNGLVPETYLA
jgi:hypothetical protein